jgi:diadenosine tetraphosphate (Ap4A) HIT family hydrolase
MSYDPDNVFAKILRGEIPCKKVYETPTPWPSTTSIRRPRSMCW